MIHDSASTPDSTVQTINLTSIIYLVLSVVLTSQTASFVVNYLCEAEKDGLAV